jgi:hypothetical protein
LFLFPHIWQKFHVLNILNGILKVFGKSQKYTCLELIPIWQNDEDPQHWYKWYCGKSPLCDKKVTKKHVTEQGLRNECGDGIFKLLRSPRIDSKEPIPPRCVARAGICKPFKEPRNRFPAWRAGTIT